MARECPFVPEGLVNQRFICTTCMPFIAIETLNPQTLRHTRRCLWLINRPHSGAVSIVKAARRPNEYSWSFHGLRTMLWNSLSTSLAWFLSEDLKKAGNIGASTHHLLPSCMQSFPSCHVGNRYYTQYTGLWESYFYILSLLHCHKATGESGFHGTQEMTVMTSGRGQVKSLQNPGNSQSWYEVST